MDSELTPIRTSIQNTYTIQALGADGWIPMYHYEEGTLGSALEDMDVLSHSVCLVYALRLIEKYGDPPTMMNIISEYYPDDPDDYGPVNDPVPWVEEGF
jgi:hypothetical protein